MQWNATVLAATFASLLFAGCSTPHAAGAAPHRRETRATSRSAPVGPLWEAHPATAPGAITADAAGTVLLGGDREVIALDHDGHEQWRTAIADLSIEYPALGAGLAVVSTARAGGKADFVALDRATGARRWHVRVAGTPGPVTVSPAHVFMVTQRGELLAFSPAGVPQWRIQLLGTFSSRGAIAYDPGTSTVASVVFALHRGWLLELHDGRTGRDVGGFDLGATDPPSAVATGLPHQLVLGTGDTHELLVIDLDARVVAHAIRTDAAFDPASVPVVANDLAVVIDRRGTVIAVNLRTGEVRWERPLARPVLDSRPLISADAVVVATWGGSLNALALADGRALPLAAAGGDGIPVAFALDAGRLVVARRLATPNRVEAWPAP
ncbi:MAG: hypothetical protein JWL83_3208 [Actinomycetia bacterium]|nr:hypothetical protein [Actinomycetes bacterium]